MDAIDSLESKEHTTGASPTEGKLSLSTNRNQPVTHLELLFMVWVGKGEILTATTSIQNWPKKVLQLSRLPTEESCRVALECRDIAHRDIVKFGYLELACGSIEAILEFKNA